MGHKESKFIGSRESNIFQQTRPSHLSFQNQKKNKHLQCLQVEYVDE